MSWQVDGTGDVESQDVEWADEDWIKGLVDWLRGQRVRLCGGWAD